MSRLGGENLKIIKFTGVLLVSLVALFVIFFFEIRTLPAGSSIAGIVLGFSLPAVAITFQDLTDTTNWKEAQRELQRGKIIKGDTIVRISFAYLFRIKLGDKYFLVKNERNTNKFQPVGGVYKMKDNEKTELKNLFHIMDDNKVLIDESSRNDYRLRMENRYLRKFVKRFDSEAKRERVSDLSREFTEELIHKGTLNWSQITYRVCGRHMTPLTYSQHFQIYELLFADVVELMLTPEQEADLRKLMKQPSSLYRFATEEEIDSLGIDTKAGILEESIADHSIKILEKAEGKLMKIPHTGMQYTVRLNK